MTAYIPSDCLNIIILTSKTIFPIILYTQNDTLSQNQGEKVSFLIFLYYNVEGNYAAKSPIKLTILFSIYLPF